jgi:hypothetical protein
MLLILLPILWLAMVALVVGVCRSAGRADATPAAPARQRTIRVMDGLTLWETPDDAGLKRERAAGQTRRRLTVHGVR